MGYQEEFKRWLEDDYFDQLAPAMEFVLKSIYLELSDYLDGVTIISNEDSGGIVHIGDQRINTKLK